MKIFCKVLITSLMVASSVAYSQEDRRDDYLKEQDSIVGTPIELEEIVIGKHQNKIDDEARKRFVILQRRVYRVYPFAKTASDRLTKLNKDMASLKTNREKKKYFKITEKYMTDEFEPQLKKLSRKDGQILVKLIHRQTGLSTFELIKELKSGWKAFWSNNAAKLFDIQLKTEYQPMQVNEDYLIENILQRAFKAGKLLEQKSPNPVDLDEMNVYWTERVREAQSKKMEE